MRSLVKTQEYAEAQSRSFRFGALAGSSAFTHADDLATQLLNTPGLCDHEAVVVVHWPGVSQLDVFRTSSELVPQLHASDLSHLPSSHELSSSIASAPANTLVPHVVAPAVAMANLHTNVSSLCGSQMSVWADEWDESMSPASFHHRLKLTMS